MLLRQAVAWALLNLASSRHAIVLQTVQTNPVDKESAMLHCAAVFFIMAIVAAVFAFTGIVAGAAGIAQSAIHDFSAHLLGHPGDRLDSALIGRCTDLFWRHP